MEPMDLAGLQLLHLGMPDFLCKPLPGWKKKKNKQQKPSKRCLCALLRSQAGQGSGGTLYTDSGPHTLRIVCSVIHRTKRLSSVRLHSAEALLGILREDGFVRPVNHASLGHKQHERIPLTQSDEAATNLTPLLAEERCISRRACLQPRPAEAPLLQDAPTTTTQSLKAAQKIYHTPDNVIAAQS